MEHIDIASEDDLLAYLMERYKLGKYPKVHGISTFKISPDIDLLHIDEHQKIITGYEFKLLKYRRDWKRVNLEPIYKGIGQALSYFQFGVDKSILILGISKDIPREAFPLVMIKIQNIRDSFETLKSFDVRIRKYNDDSFEESPVSERIKLMLPETHCGWNCFGIKVWIAHDDLLVTKLNADKNFPIYLREKLKHRKECLLRKEFKYKQKFLAKHKARIAT